MENQSDGVESEQISEAFICCICLDLLYKPIVLACGHVSCFWCVQSSMSGLCESRCPICRHPYRHFPTICQMLHFLLLKMYPVAYKQRENHILEEETKTGLFSPKVDDLLCALHTNQEPNQLDNHAESSTESNGENLSTRKEEACAQMEQLEFVAFVQDNSSTIPKQITAESFEAPCTVGGRENNTSQRSCNGICQKVSIPDVLCAACKQLLFRPAVLNCGHVYCEACIILADETIRCPVCQSAHPSSSPKVWLEFDHFLEEQFPEEYIARKGKVQQKQVQFLRESPPKGEEDFVHWWGDHSSNVHFGVGCDSCGMYPIIGDRYRCKDCKEVAGFDLCGECYNTRSKLPGRFNQQHTPDHKFEMLSSDLSRNIMLTLLNIRNSEDGFLSHSLSGDASENPEDALPLVTPSASSDTEEPQNDDTQHPTS